MDIQTILKYTPEQYKEKVTVALNKYAPIVEQFQEEIFTRLREVSNKPYITAASEYLFPVKKISIYMRYGAGRAGRYGHDTLCIANIEVPKRLEHKGFFTALIFSLIAECQQRKIILMVENPLERFFQDFLLRIGFICSNRDSLGIGTFHHPIDEGQISLYPFYNMDKEHAE